MIETMTKQPIEFAKFIREHDLSHEINFRFISFIPNVNLCDDGTSFFTLESGLEEVLDPPLSTLPLVALPSPSTSRDNTAFIMAFSDPLFPLAQLAEFEASETFGISAPVDEDNTCCELGDVFIEVFNLGETSLRKPCVAIVVTIPPSPKSY